MTEKKGFYGWIALAAASIMYLFLCGGAINSFGAFLPSICREFGWTREAVSRAFASAMMVMTLSGPLAGFLVGKYGPRKAMVFGNFLAASMLFGIAFMTSFWHLQVGYAILGLGVGVGGIMAASVLASRWFIKKVPLAMSILSGSGAIGGLLIIPLVMALVNRFGWRPAYIVASLMIFVFGVIIPGVIVRNRPEDMGQVPDGEISGEKMSHGPEMPGASIHATPVDFTVKEGLRTASFWLLTFCGVAPMYVVMFLTAHQIAFLTDLGISAETAAMTVGVMMGVSAVGTLSVGVLSLKFPIKVLVAIAAAFISASMVLALMTRSAPMAFLYSILCGLGFGGVLVALMSLMPAYFGRTNYPQLMGISMIFGVFSAAGAPVSGYLYEVNKSYTMAIIVALVVSVAGLLALIMARPPVHPSLKEPRTT